jgi:hypothetical protein
MEVRGIDWHECVLPQAKQLRPEKRFLPRPPEAVFHRAPLLADTSGIDLSGIFADSHGADLEPVFSPSAKYISLTMERHAGSRDTNPRGMQLREAVEKLLRKDAVA